MLLGVLDLSFLASQDFRSFLKSSEDVSFAMYSPLAWKLGYTKYGILSKRDKEFKEYIEPFFRKRIEEVENANIHLMRENLRIGIDQGRILLIRNVFFKFYKQLYSMLDMEDEHAEAVAVTDLSNLLLANQLKLPLWMEKNAESWINKVYHFRRGKRSELITLPIVSGNPRNYLRDTLTKLIRLFNQEVKFEEIVKQLKEDAKKALKIAYLSKAVVLSTLEPLPIWETLGLPYRYLVSAILTITDIVAMREFVKF